MWGVVDGKAGGLADARHIRNRGVHVQVTWFGNGQETIQWRAVNRNSFDKVHTGGQFGL